MSSDPPSSGRRRGALNPALATANAELGRQAASGLVDVREAFRTQLRFDDPASVTRWRILAKPCTADAVKDFLAGRRDFDDEMRDLLAPILEHDAEYFHRMQRIEHRERANGRPHSVRWTCTKAGIVIAPS
jgi:hypothetical protein